MFNFSLILSNDNDIVGVCIYSKFMEKIHIMDIFQIKLWSMSKLCIFGNERVVESIKSIIVLMNRDNSRIIWKMKSL